MQRSKRLYLLLGVLAVVCIAAFAVTRWEEKKEQIKTGGETVLAVSPDEVESISWDYGETSLSFHRQETWQYDGDANFPVDGDKMATLLSVFESFGVSFIIEDVTDEGLYGLDDPVCTIRFATAETEYTVTLGDYSTIDQERYVSLGDGKVYLAKTDPLDSFNAVLDDLIRHDEALSYSEVTRITFQGAENYSLYRDEGSENAYCADDLYYTERGGETVPLDTERVSTYLEALTTLSLTDYMTYHVSESELAAFGLDAPELTVTVDYTDTEGAAQTYTLAVSRDPAELAAAEEAESAGEEPEAVTAYVRVGDSPLVYCVTEYESNSLRAASFDHLRHRQVLAADWSDVQQLDVTLEGEDYTLTADDEGSWHYGDRELDMDDLQTALERLQVAYTDDFTADSPTGKQEIALTVHLGSERRPQVTIALYRHDGEQCLAVVDGTPLARIARSEVVDLMEAVNAIVLN